MRLILKNKDQYCRIFKLTADSNKNSIVGNLMLFDMLQSYLPNVKNTDFHFTYFRNGNYHFSFKYYDSGDGLYYDRKRYHNHVAIQKSESLILLKDSEPNRRDIDENDPLDMFMMDEPLLSWDNRPIGHTFSVVGMSFSADGLKKVDWLEQVNFDEDSDLMVDVEQYAGHQVSFGCSFYNEGNPVFDFNLNPPKVPYFEKIFSMDKDLCLKVYVVIIPKWIFKDGSITCFKKGTPYKIDDIRLDVENLKGVLDMGFIIYSGNEGDFPLKGELATELKIMKVSDNVFVGGYLLVAKWCDSLPKDHISLKVRRFTFNVFASLAEFERELINEWTKAGLTAARARWRKGDRPPGFTKETSKIKAVKVLYDQLDKPMIEIAANLSMSRASACRIWEVAKQWENENLNIKLKKHS
jgi:hypothetical protein